MSLPVNPNPPNPQQPTLPTGTPPSQAIRRVNQVSVDLVEQAGSSANYHINERDRYAELKPFFLRHQKDPYNKLHFYISYNGKKAPITIEKLSALAAKAKAQLESSYSQIAIQINALVGQGNFRPLNAAEKNHLKLLQAQKFAFENIQTYEFKAEGNIPTLKLTYRQGKEIKPITILLDGDIDKVKELTIDQHIADMVFQPKKRRTDLLKKLAEFGLTQVERDELNDLQQAIPHLENPANYSISYESNQTFITFTNPNDPNERSKKSLQNTSYAKTIPIYITQGVTGETRLHELFNESFTVFGEVIQENRANFAVESEYQKHHQTQPQVNPRKRERDQETIEEIRRRETLSRQQPNPFQS